MEQIETVVIGGGQAGLSMSYHLARLGIEHVVLERGRIAERWRSERWNSLVFQFPNWMLRLPGHAYGGDAPDDFMPAGGIVRFLEDYARRTSPPLRCGVRVTELRPGTSGRWCVATDTFDLEARHVVVATGPYQRPVVPAFSRSLPIATFQTTASAYTDAQSLPPGGVLVVGTGGSGWQIAEDLLRSERRVFLSIGRHRRVPRRYRGRDFGWWQEQTGAADRVVDEVTRALPAPLLTGVDGGRDADLRALAQGGATLLGSLGAVGAGRLRFVADLRANLAKGDETFAQFTQSVDEHIRRQRLPAPEEPTRHVASVEPVEIAELGVQAAGIASVVWAVGYRNDFDWIRSAPFDAHGRPIQRRGVSPLPGLYFLGLPRMYTLKSAFLWGVGDDAAHLAGCIAQAR